ncbi:hypothetical protein ACMFMG_003849 [Clarireedia jacksonii]
MSTSRPVTPASPKLVKIKSPQPGVPKYGCHFEDAERATPHISYAKLLMPAMHNNDYGTRPYKTWSRDFA